jgi:ABC-type sugar transport system substrate-binding protein
MIKKKVVALFVVLVMVLTVMAGCGSGSGTDSSEKTGDGPKASAPLAGKDINKDNLKIAYIPFSTAGYTNVLAEKASNDFREAYPNVEVNFFDAGYDPTTQISLLSECIAQKYDGIIMEVSDSVALSPTITEAEAAGIPVISLNMGTDTLHTLHLESNSYSSGWLGGEAIGNALGGKGNVVILDVPAQIKATALFGTGFEDYIAENTELKVLDAQPIDGFSQEEANTVMSNLLTKFDDIDAVYCAADTVAMGAIQAIDAAGRDKDGILIWGSAAYPSALDAIDAGKMFGTSWEDLYSVVKMALNMELYFIAAGINSVSAGYTATPSLYEPFVAVTKDNSDAIKPQTRWPEYS